MGLAADASELLNSDLGVDTRGVQARVIHWGQPSKIKFWSLFGVPSSQIRPLQFLLEFSIRASLTVWQVFGPLLPSRLIV